MPGCFSRAQVAAVAQPQGQSHLGAIAPPLEGEVRELWVDIGLVRSLSTP